MGLEVEEAKAHPRMHVFLPRQESVGSTLDHLILCPISLWPQAADSHPDCGIQNILLVIDIYTRFYTHQSWQQPSVHGLGLAEQKII
jgi:hypothetical protein